MTTKTKTFSALRKQSSNFDALKNKIKEKTEKKSYADQRFWKPGLDKAGNGQATIRFLPAIETEELPFVELFTHSVKGPGGWFIENCPTTLGKDHKCPLCELNRERWNSDSEAMKKLASEQKRKLSYISNIYVVSDPANPENEGKVFLYSYGKKIFDKVNALMSPEDEDEAALNPFDVFEGANFKLKVKKVANFPNYDDSKFMSQSALLGGDDAKLDEMFKGAYSLLELVSADKFKSYDELKARLTKVLGGASGSLGDTIESDMDKASTADAATSGGEWEADDVDNALESMKLGSDDDSLAHLKSLIDED